MSEKRPSRPLVRALEEAHFGSEGMLNLRDSLPTRAEAVARAEAWLRERQVLGGGEVMIVTGRGKGSPEGKPVVREGILGLLNSLRRRGVVKDFAERGPGAFVVSLASMGELFSAPRRAREIKRGNTPVEAVRAPALPVGLSPELLERLGHLAQLSLAGLGIKSTRDFVEDEVRRQFTLLSGSLPTTADKESQLLGAVNRAIAEIEDGVQK